MLRKGGQPARTAAMPDPAHALTIAGHGRCHSPHGVCTAPGLRSVRRIVFTIYFRPKRQPLRPLNRHRRNQQRPVRHKILQQQVIHGRFELLIDRQAQQIPAQSQRQQAGQNKPDVRHGFRLRIENDGCFIRMPFRSSPTTSGPNWSRSRKHSIEERRGTIRDTYRLVVRYFLLKSCPSIFIWHRLFSSRSHNR